MMNQYLLEPFLTEYYLLEAVCDSFLEDSEKRNIFFELARVFCLTDREVIDEYFHESITPPVSEISDIASYERFCRTVEYAKKYGKEIVIDERDRLILAQKRAAMTIKAEIFSHGRNLTRETVSVTLLQMARNGNIDAMALLSYMEYNGIGVCRDTKNAVKRLRLCAKWNNLFGNLMGIAYDDAHRSEYYDNLFTILRHASQKPVFEDICRVSGYDGVPTTNPIARIVDKAFGLSLIKRNQYDQVFAKIAFSSIISLEDKEKLLLSRQPEMLATLGDIPFDVKTDGSFSFDSSSVERLPVQREKETRKIMQNFTVAQCCPVEVYTPLMIVTSGEYVSDMYIEMLKDCLRDEAVFEIDAGVLTRHDFVPGRENVFLRGLSETRSARTVFLVKNCEELDGELIEELKKLLDYGYRKRFKIFQPNVSLDISAMMFILLADERNPSVMTLSDCCDTVWSDRISSAEKAEVVDSIFTSRAHSFGRDGIVLDDGCREYLSDFDTRQIQQIIDGALKRAVFEKTDHITPVMLQTVCTDQNIVASRRGFGFIGGTHNA